MQKTWTSALRVSALLILCGALAVSVSAQPLDDQADPREKLEMLQRKLEQDRALEQKLDQERTKLATETARLQKALVEAASNVRKREADLAMVEADLNILESKEAIAAKAFYERRDQLAGLLAVLQRMGREPPPALVVRPENAAVAARSAMVLTAVLPGVRAEAKRLADDLGLLRTLRNAAAESRVNLNRAGEALASEQKRLTAYLEEKQKLTTKTAADWQVAAGRVKVLSSEKQDLENLIRRVEGQVRTLHESGFSSADFLAKRGALSWPANGQLIANFGDEGEFGVRRTALTLKTRKNAQIVSPVDGRIVFAGPFKGYDQLLIISAGDGYHIVLSGMARIDGSAGQVLLAGEPIGQMGDNPGSGSDSGGQLNIEFRHEGQPVDPAPWFDGHSGNARDKGHG